MKPEILNGIFDERTNHYNLRENSSFNSRRAQSVYHGTESLSYLGPKIWDLVPEVIRASESLDIFKRNIKKWIPKNYPCRLCKTYSQGVGFI